MNWGESILVSRAFTVFRNIGGQSAALECYLAFGVDFRNQPPADATPFLRKMAIQVGSPCLWKASSGVIRSVAFEEVYPGLVCCWSGCGAAAHA